MKKNTPKSPASKTSETLAAIGESANDANMGIEDAIRGRAYSLYLAEGRPEGRDLEHWLAAEADCNAALKNGEAPGSGEAETADLQVAREATKSAARSRKRTAA